MPNLLESEEGDLFEHEDGTLVTDEDGAPCCCQGGGVGLTCCEGDACGYAPLPLPASPRLSLDVEGVPDFSVVSFGGQFPLSGPVPPSYASRLVFTTPQPTQTQPDGCLWTQFIANGMKQPGATRGVAVGADFELRFGPQHHTTNFVVPTTGNNQPRVFGEMPDWPSVAVVLTPYDVRQPVIWGTRSRGTVGCIIGIGSDKRQLVWGQNNRQSFELLNVVPGSQSWNVCGRFTWSGLDMWALAFDPVIGLFESVRMTGDFEYMFHSGLGTCPGESAPGQLPGVCQRPGCFEPVDPSRSNCRRCGLCNGCGG